MDQAGMCADLLELLVREGPGALKGPTVCADTLAAGGATDSHQPLGNPPGGD